jgi:hypothetical protein
MSDYETKWERVDEDSPLRCQYISPNVGQCRNKQVEGSKFCPAHGGNKAFQAAEKRRLINYRLTKYKERIGSSLDSDQLLSLKEEVAILRMLIEEKLNKCESSTDLILMAGPLSDLIVKVEKLVSSCSRLDLRLGNLLDKGRVLQFAQTLIQIVSDEIDDEKILEKISLKIIEALKNGEVTSQE